MVNKKKRVSRHQNDPCSIPNGSTIGDSTESCDENHVSVQGICSCEHVLKAVDLSRVKKALKIAGGLLQQCKECKKTGPKESVFGIESMGTGELWLCLKCGNQACGREEGEHALKHHKTPRSECHALVVGTESWNVWCYSCNQSIAPSCKKKLSECIDFVKRQHVAAIPVTVRNHSLITDPVASDMNQANSSPLTLKTGSNVRKAKGINAIVNSLPRVRGLSNLGNTCFFNALLQCLARTPFLLPMLHEMSVPGKRIVLPGGSTPITKDLGQLPELEGELGIKCGALLETLTDTLEEVQSAKVDCFSPNKLFQKVTQRCPQFAGGDQHDSHELLRQLLEAVRAEDLKRYQSIILHKLGLSEKSCPLKVEEELKVKVKAYGQQASELTMCPEPIFQGVLVSTLECQECSYTSQLEEKFLDLSLPIIADKPQPPSVRRKGNHVEMNGMAIGGQPSKYQLKKEKQQARKGRNKKQKNVTPNGQSEELNNDDNNKTFENASDKSEQSDADVEDNVDAELETKSNQDVGESGYSSDKQCNEESIVDRPVNGDSAISSPYSPINSIPDSLFNSVHEEEKLNRSNSLSPSSLSSEINIEIDDHNSTITENNCTNLMLPNANSPTSNCDLPNDEAGKLCNDVSEKLAEDIKRLSVSNYTTNTCMALVPFNPVSAVNLIADNKSSPIPIGWYDNHEDSGSSDRGNSFFDSAIKSGKRGNSDTDCNGTLAPRYQCEEGDLSLESCLNQFTAIELMTGSNMVGCERCTKQHNHNNKEGKTVYTNSTKQLLIKSVPPVLILHLKRFQVQKAMLRKMSKHVSFPLILDIAPICSIKCKDTSSSDTQQNKILYSLYGIVEHSGTLHKGHYVAYVKVRVPVEPNDPRWAFLPSACGDKIFSLQKEQIPCTNNSVPQPPEGKWYCVSDSHVSEVGEDRVLKSQAYLLFYERIW